MPAFCYLKHSPSDAADAALARMADRLVPGALRQSGRVHQQTLPGGTLLYWQAPHYPVSFARQPDGGAALLMGEALPETGAAFAAPQVYAHPESLQLASGTFAWLRIAPDGSLRAGTDPFGLFPLYFFAGPHAFGLASHVSPLREHPEFNRTLDPVGLFRVLIENGVSGRRTLEEGARRLEIGEILSLPSDQTQPRLQHHPAPWIEVPDKNSDPATAVDLSVDLSRKAIHRLLQGNASPHMLLSGGLDSRHIAALMHERRLRPDSYTFGKPTDFEAFLAGRTARKIRARWHCLPDDLADGPGLAQLELDLLSLAGGFSTVTLRGVESAAKHGGTSLFSGLILDAMYAPALKSVSEFPIDSFNYSLDLWINRFGVPPATLKDFALPGVPQEALHAALAEIEAEWRAYPGDVTDRLWYTIFRHRIRPHLGGYLWKSSFYAQLKLPALDVPLVTALRGISGELHKGRHLQRQTVVALNPALARIPLDTITTNPGSILPSRWNAWHQKRFLATLKRQGITDHEAQRFLRIMTLNHPAWSAIREKAEPGRPLLQSWFDAEKLAAFLPPASQGPLPPAMSLAQQGRSRLLLGLMCWLQEQ